MLKLAGRFVTFEVQEVIQTLHHIYGKTKHDVKASAEGDTHNGKDVVVRLFIGSSTIVYLIFVAVLFRFEK